jgi:hypothetical protein
MLQIGFAVYFVSLKLNMMGKITGRPPKLKKQEKFLGFFVTNTQHFVIQQKVEEARLTMSDYLRQTAMYGQVKPRWTAEERDWFKRMVALCNEVTDLVKIARTEGATIAMLHFIRYRELIDEIINTRLTND